MTLNWTCSKGHFQRVILNKINKTKIKVCFNIDVLVNSEILGVATHHGLNTKNTT